jgi:purine nucleosidase
MRVFVDTDLNFPSDDFQALMLLLAAPEVEVVGCGAAAGNTWAEEVCANIRLAMDAVRAPKMMLGKGPPHGGFLPYRDAALAAKERGVRAFVGAHEKSAAPRDWVLGQSSEPSVTAAEALISASREYPEDLAVVCIAPLTNLRMALEIDPKLADRLRTVTVMGGHFSKAGADEVAADFNFWFDPESAHEVLNSGLDIRVVPLDVCKSLRVTDFLLERLSRWSRGRAAVFVDDFLGMFRQHGPSMALADQLAVLVCLDPSLVLLEQRGRVKVDQSDGNVRGRSVLIPDQFASVRVVRAADVEGAHARMLSLVERMSHQECNPFGTYETPTFQYYSSQRLAQESVTVIRAEYDGGYRVKEVTELDTAAEFARAIAPLARLLVRAKERSELWPPAPRADAIIARSEGLREIQLDRLALAELERLTFERFLQVRAIATLSTSDGAVRGFSCTSDLTPHRRQEMTRQFGVDLSSGSVIAEFDYVERRTCGFWASEYLTYLLLRWCGERRPGEEIPVLAVALASQTVSRYVMKLLGFEPIARHIIPEGPEMGRELLLYSLQLDEGRLKRLQLRYGD